MPCFYVLYSEKLGRYYLGSTAVLPEVRLAQHNSKHFDEAYTRSGIPWRLVLYIPTIQLGHARAIERHCKRMKSKKYIENLIAFPEMQKKLFDRYKNSS